MIESVFLTLGEDGSKSAIIHGVARLIYIEAYGILSLMEKLSLGIGFVDFFDWLTMYSLIDEKKLQIDKIMERK